MPITIMAKNYSHCPLKKRPIVFKEEQDVPEEPENLSTKPEDLSRTGRLASVSPPSSPQSSPDSRDSRLSPVSSVSIGSSHRDSPPTSPPMPSPIQTSFYPTQPIKVESRLPSYPPPISPEYAPQTWHRSVAPMYHPAYYPVPYPHYAHESVYLTPNSPYSESSLSPPHHMQQPLQPLALRPTVYSSIDQNSLSPNSSTHSPPPMTLGSAEELTEKRKQGVRHQCPDCGKSYSTFSGLSKHRQFHCAAGDGPKKTFSCKYCEKVYVSLGALKMHIRTHTLPCKCTICGKAFSRPWLLQGHIRTHTGEKPFSCTYCNRAFADRSNLRAHLQTHSDVKKYSCASCSKTFSRMSLLTKHTEGGCSATSPMLLHSVEKMY